MPPDPPSHGTAVRPALAEDLTAVRALAEGAYALYLPRMDRRPAPMDADYAAVIREGRMDVLSDGGDSGRNGTVRGFIVHFARDGDWFVETIAVDPARQGLGYGHRLMAHAEARARAAGRTVIALYTNAAMTENLTYYPRLGYRESARRVEDGFARVYFEKRLPDAPAS
ncbi:GNAT family N-acetyltransferase [Marivibrio halodurans]|uniref:GNAT family N-acetyltransferase n=1 Tax=Marivibrio halodurans TaxID=2039722 RepID=A0A8J7S137_9PROT|nr:GNAT family N-acetyltransferase [Marivibrio halodurans]MBP5858320.1 GNAT family N-acetyltransferase [Marivibrio halodurans]